ncbi:hypothetical protein [Henriciella barbarensis]|nr:hypothetical protein [Henriciella barbarensis]
MIPDEKMGEFTLRFRESLEGFSGLAFNANRRSEVMHASSLEKLRAKLSNFVGRVHPNYFGWDGAYQRFVGVFPGGFHSDDYKSAERNYKEDARKLLEERLPLSSVQSNSGMGEAALAVFRKTNLLSPFEQTRIQALLRSRRADDFVRAAATFTLGDRANGLRSMEHAALEYDVAKWTAISYLPYLWAPTVHMFLKPEVTRDCAERVGHEFQYKYEPALNPSVYESLIDLTHTAKAELEARGALPSDNIDIQSFIWIAGKYE